MSFSSQTLSTPPSPSTQSSCEPRIRHTVFCAQRVVIIASLPFDTRLRSQPLSSLKTDKHVHGHLYIHLRKAFHRKGPRALDCFSFQGVCPHLEKNTAKGNAYKGAVKYGHFYVFVDKIGSLFSDADFKPFEDYGVEGWWLDNLVKQGKLDRETYLSWAARVTVGFQRRLVEVRAA